VAEGRPRANQHGEQLSCAGSLAVKSTPILTNMLPFAGERASEELGLLEDSRRESPALRCIPQRATMGCSSYPRRRGISNHLAMRRRMRGEGGVLHSGRLGPRKSIVTVSTHHRRNW